MLTGFIVGSVSPCLTPTAISPSGPRFQVPNLPLWGRSPPEGGLGLGTGDPPEGCGAGRNPRTAKAGQGGSIPWHGFTAGLPSCARSPWRFASGIPQPCPPLPPWYPAPRVRPPRRLSPSTAMFPHRDAMPRFPLASTGERARDSLPRLAPPSASQSSPPGGAGPRGGTPPPIAPLPSGVPAPPPPRPLLLVAVVAAGGVARGRRGAGGQHPGAGTGEEGRGGRNARWRPKECGVQGDEIGFSQNWENPIRHAPTPTPAPRPAPVHTSKVLATKASVSHGTMDMVLAIKRHGNAELLDKMRAGEGFGGIGLRPAGPRPTLPPVPLKGGAVRR